MSATAALDKSPPDPYGNLLTILWHLAQRFKSWQILGFDLMQIVQFLVVK
jgi:hypothetical protein